MADTTLRSGKPMIIDYTPTGGAVAEGEVVLLGNTTSPSVGIAQRPIANSELGALAVGGGIYDVVNLNNSANYALVYWDLVNNTRKVTSVSTNNAQFGFIVSDGGGGANSTARALHWPIV